MSAGTVKDSRVQWYLGVTTHDNTTDYQNTDEERELAMLWSAKFELAKHVFENHQRVNSAKLKTWRNAYFGTFFKLDQNGAETTNKQKALRKVAYELVESKIITLMPGPKMSPRYHSDIFLVNATEALINHEIDRMLSEEVHDESEHSCLIDGTTWLKVEWDPFDNTNERSGMPKVINCPIDSVYPQPGINDYKKLEYIFEQKTMTLSTIMDLYGRKVTPDNGTDLIDVVEVYYLNKDRVVGHLVFTKDSLTVLSNDVEWGMRKVRVCSKCKSKIPSAVACPICGNTHFSI